MNTLTDVRRRRWALAALALPTLLVAIDISVMGVALPSLAATCIPAPPSCCGSSTATTSWSPDPCSPPAPSVTGSAAAA
ncbi:hypothetical protein ACIBI7_24350 [Nonomuraea fuscirosea]|uniref:hypothetical protein n=1 Tax=Nonomuraea fuscirosea TaxID=1291556 RepID=UPI003789881E